jgi:hypothetical protein
VSELPATRDTLLLRLMGKAPAREQALEEIRALPPLPAEPKAFGVEIFAWAHSQDEITAPSPGRPFCTSRTPAKLSSAPNYIFDARIQSHKGG